MKNIFFLLLISVTISYAQIGDFNPGYDWFTIGGEHVKVHFHDGAERTARVVLKIAEEVWGPITSLYEYEPGIVHFVIKDIDDYSNGATYFFDNKIEIWASALDFDLRGAHNWLRNVISHEFTHMVQIQAAMKMGRGIPAIYLQVLNYEDVYRPDILYGYPNVIVSYPLATINMPAWFAEGTAQYMRKEFDYDNWDSHRDMILRSYALDDNMLTWNQMGVFSKTSLGNESVYNSGFALTRYISQKYGEDKLREITEKLGKLTNFTIDAAFEDVLGKDGDEIYNEWSSFLKKNYKSRMKDVLENLVEGETLIDEGFGNFYPVFSPDGKKMLYVSNDGSDYFSLSSIYEYDFETKESKVLIPGVRSTVAYIPGENKIVYAKLSDDNPKWTNIHDLYVYDVEEEESERITFGLRANNPSISHDGKKIVFLFQKDGTTNLGQVDVEGKNFRKLTFFENGEQVYNPKFANDDSFIYFDYSYANGRDIAKVDTSGGKVEFILQTKNDERNPTFDSDGNMIYASDKTGIFNLYKINLQTKKTTQLTNVSGGAFMPEVDKEGNLLYAGYKSTGYKIFKISFDEQKKVDPSKKYVWIGNPPLNEDKPNGDLSKFDINRLRNYDDKNDLPDVEKKKYSGFFSRLTFFPFIRYDNHNPQNNGLDKIKPGLYVTSSDVLDRYNFFAGAAINRRWERDLFFIFEYKNKLPLLYDIGLKPNLSLEVYSISRSNDMSVFFGVDSTYNPPHYDFEVPVEVSFDLFEFDIAAKHRFFSKKGTIETRFIYSNYTAVIGSFMIPNTNTLYPKTKDTYFIGRDIRLTYNYVNKAPSRYMDINPIGREVTFKYDYEFNKFNDSGEYVVEDGILKPNYGEYNFHRLELHWKEYFSTFRNHSLSMQLRLATILGPPVPDFFDFYLGGLIGMKSYPFYAVSGNELSWINLTYRFPVFTNIDSRVGQLYIDNIFFSVFGDIGNAWTGNEIPSFEQFKKGAGFEVRIKMNSFYLFPTSLFFSAAYSFNEFDRIVYGKNVHYGKEWRLYGGILFDFGF